MCGSDLNAASTVRPSSGLSKARAAVLFEAIASLRMRSCCSAASRLATNSPSMSSSVVTNNAAPLETSAMVLSFRRIGTGALTASFSLPDDLGGAQQLRADDEIAGLRRREIDAHADAVVVVDERDDGAQLLG